MTRPLIIKKSGGSTSESTHLEPSGYTFVVGEPVYIGSSGLRKSQAIAGQAYFTGFVKSITEGSPRLVTIQQSGNFVFPSAHGLTGYVWLREDSPGLTSTMPSINGSVGMRLGFVIDTITIGILPEPPYVVGSLLMSQLPSIPPGTFLVNTSTSDAPPSAQNASTVASLIEPFITATAAPTPPSVISGTEISFADGSERFKNIAAHTTFSVTNQVEGQRVRIDLSNTSGSSVNVTFTGAKTPADAQLTLAASTQGEFELVRKNGVLRARIVQTGYTLDTVPPVISFSIDSTGTILTGASTEPMYLDGATPTNVSLTNLTPSVTLSGFALAGDRMTFTYAISRAVLPSGTETPQITIGASNGIRDAAGNQVQAVTGGSVTNSSTANSYWRLANYESGTPDSGVTLSGTGVTSGYSPGPNGSNCLRVVGGSSSSFRGSTWAGTPTTDGGIFWTYDELTIDATPTASGDWLYFRRASDDAVQAKIRVFSGGTIQLLNNSNAGTGSFAATSEGASANTGVLIRLLIRKNANGSFDGFATTTTTFPSTPNLSCTATNTGTTGKVDTGANLSGIARWDKGRGSATAIVGIPA